MTLAFLLYSIKGAQAASPKTEAPPPTAAPAPTTALPQPTLSAEQFTALDESAWRRFYLAETLPDPKIAFTESLILGFGTGHFYTKDLPMAYVHMGIQTGGLALAGIGALTYIGAPDADHPRHTRQTSGEVIGVGATMFVVDRIIDIATAPAAAHRRAAQEIEAEHRQAANAATPGS